MKPTTKPGQYNEHIDREDARRVEFARLVCMGHSKSKAFVTTHPEWRGSQKGMYNAASNFFVDPKTQEIVRKIQADSLERVAMNARDVMERFECIADADITEAIDPNTPLPGFIAMKDWPIKLRRAISKVKVSPDGTVEVALWSKSHALEQLGKSLGVYEADNLQKNGVLPEGMTRDELAAIKSTIKSIIGPASSVSEKSSEGTAPTTRH